MVAQIDMPAAKILIVDDTFTDAEIVSDVLRHAGYEIALAEDGENALNQTDRFQPDLILLDVLLPGLDGFEICHRLKANQATQDIPVIFLTSLDTPTNIVKGFEVGAVDYINKPIRYQELLARVKTHLTIHQLQKELHVQNEHLQNENIRRQRVQETLKESRERYRLLAENATDIISQLTPVFMVMFRRPVKLCWDMQLRRWWGILPMNLCIPRI